MKSWRFIMRRTEIVLAAQEKVGKEVRQAQRVVQKLITVLLMRVGTLPITRTRFVP